MKILTKEEEAAHYSATVQGGTIGVVAGLALGVAGVYAASARYHFVRHLTLPLKAFLVTSSGTFVGIIAADRASRQFQANQNPVDREFREREKERYQAEYGNMSWTERSMAWGKDHRYQIVGGSWVASMVAAFAMVNRNKYLTGPQKLVQARVYAQFLTVGVLVASAAFEIADSRNKEGKYEEIRYVDPNDPEHRRILTRREPVHESDGDNSWRDMVAAEEWRLKERDADEARLRKRHQKLHEQMAKASSKEEKDQEESEEEDNEEEEKSNTKSSKKEKKSNA